MFNLFHKKRETHPIADVFKNFPQNQRIAILNLLLTVANADGDEGHLEKELEYLNIYRRVFEISSQKAMQFLENYGVEQIVEDLMPIKKEQKDFLAMACWMMIICDGAPNKIEIQVAGGILEEIGVQPDDFFSIIQKITNLTSSLYTSTEELKPEKNLKDNLLKVKVTKVSSKASTNGNFIHTVKTEGKKVNVLGQEKVSGALTYFIALPAATPVGSEHEIDMDLFSVTERPYTPKDENGVEQCNPETGEVIVLQLKWLAPKKVSETPSIKKLYLLLKNGYLMTLVKENHETFIFSTKEIGPLKLIYKESDISIIVQQQNEILTFQSQLNLSLNNTTHTTLSEKHLILESENLSVLKANINKSLGELVSSDFFSGLSVELYPQDSEYASLILSFLSHEHPLNVINGLNIIYKHFESLFFGFDFNIIELKILYFSLLRNMTFCMMGWSENPKHKLIDRITKDYVDNMYDYWGWDSIEYIGNPKMTIDELHYKEFLYSRIKEYESFKNDTEALTKKMLYNLFIAPLSEYIDIYAESIPLNEIKELELIFEEAESYLFSVVNYYDFELGKAKKIYN